MKTNRFIGIEHVLRCDWHWILNNEFSFCSIYGHFVQLFLFSIQLKCRSVSNPFMSFHYRSFLIEEHTIIKLSKHLDLTHFLTLARFKNVEWGGGSLKKKKDKVTEGWHEACHHLLRLERRVRHLTMENIP